MTPRRPRPQRRRRARIAALARVAVVVASPGCSLLADGVPCDEARPCPIGACVDGVCVRAADRDDAGTPRDGGDDEIDGGIGDAGAPDAGALDAGVVDAGADPFPCAIDVVVDGHRLDAGAILDAVVPVALAVNALPGNSAGVAFEPRLDGGALAFQVERGQAQQVIWVRVPRVDGDGPTRLSVRYAFDPSLVVDAAGDPWAGYDAVLHVSDPAADATGDIDAVYAAPDGGASPLLSTSNGVFAEAILCGPQGVLDGAFPLALGAPRVTMSAWLSGVADGEAAAFAAAPGVPTSRFSVGILGGVHYGLARSTAGDDAIVATASVAPGAGWHHVALVVDYPGRTLTLYVDGERRRVLVDAGFAGTTAPTDPTPRVSLCASENGTLPFSGRIDEVRLAPEAIPPARLRLEARAVGADPLVVVGAPTCP